MNPVVAFAQCRTDEPQQVSTVSVRINFVALTACEDLRKRRRAKEIETSCWSVASEVLSHRSLPQRPAAFRQLHHLVTEILQTLYDLDRCVCGVGSNVFVHAVGNFGSIREKLGCRDRR